MVEGKILCCPLMRGMPCMGKQCAVATNTYKASKKFGFDECEYFCGLIDSEHAYGYVQLVDHEEIPYDPAT